MSREDPGGPKPEEAQGLVRGGSGKGRGKVGTQVPVRILGHSVGVTKALSLVRMFQTEERERERLIGY